MYPSHFGTEIRRIKALGAVGLSLLLILVFASAAQAMPAEPPSGWGGGDDATVSQTLVDGHHYALVRQHLGESVPATVGGQERAEDQHLVESVPATVAGPVGGQERAEIQHVGEAPQPVAELDPAPSTHASSNSDTELLLAIASILALTGFGGLMMWSRRRTIKTA